MRKTLWRAGDALMLLAFVFSAVVQVNDPDPWTWVAVYGLAALACILSLAGRGHWLFPAALALVTFTWMLTIAPRVLGDVPFGAMFDAWEMANAGIEESREMYGLAIVAVWMALLAWRKRRPVAGEGSSSAHHA